MIEPVFASKEFRCASCRDCDVPGYMILTPTPSPGSIAELTYRQKVRLGDVLAKIEKAVTTATGADRVYVLRFSEGLETVHFHIFPRTAELEARYCEATGSSGTRNGEEMFAWARHQYRTDTLSDRTTQTSAMVRSMCMGPVWTSGRGPVRRLVLAASHTYGFEAPVQTPTTARFSPLIWLPAVLLFGAKFLWGAELLRFLARWFATQEDAAEVHPAWSDSYTLLMPLVTLAVLLGADAAPGWTTAAFAYAAWRLFEDLGSSFHSLVMRPVLSGRPVRSEFRYLVATVVRAVEAWLSLVIMWNSDRAHLLSVPSSLPSDRQASLLHVFYYVSTTLSTVGYGDFLPNPKEDLALELAILTQFTAVTMLTILVSKAFSLVSPKSGPAGSASR